MNTAAADFSRILLDAFEGRASTESLAPMKVRRALLYRTDDRPEGDDRVSDYLSAVISGQESEILVGVNTRNDRLYLIKLCNGSKHGTLGCSFYLAGEWEEIFWSGGATNGFMEELTRAYPRISLYGIIPTDSLQDFVSAALDTGYDMELGVGNWDVAAQEIIQGLITSSGGRAFNG